MTGDERSEPDRDLARLVGGLPAALPPPDALEARVVCAVRPPSVMRRSVLAAAAVVIFAIGLAAGRLVPRAPSPADTGGFVLLLYEDDDYRPAEAADASARVDEYRAWARQVAEQGIAISGERLQSDGLALRRRDGDIRRGAAAERLGGYFVIGASSREEAERIATTCPHLRYGGRVVLKAILPT